VGIQHAGIAWLVTGGGLWLAALGGATAGTTPAPTIVADATFENISLEVNFDAAAPADLQVGLQLRAAGGGAFRAGHPLSRLSTTRFAGSAFNLKPGTRYELRLDFPGADSNQVIALATREDQVPTPDGPVFHVDPTQGDDRNDGGTASQAFQSLRRALQELRPGVTLLLHGGCYHEGDLSVTQSGTAEQPIVIRSAPGEYPVIDATASSFAPQWELHDSRRGIYRSPCSFTPANAYADGEQLFGYPRYDDLRDGRWGQAGGFVADGEYLYVRLPARGDPGGHAITIPAHSAGLTLAAGVAFVHIVGLEFAHIGYKQDHCGISLDGAHSNRIEQCRFRQVGPGITLRHGASGNVIQQSFFTEAPIGHWPWQSVKEGNGSYEMGGVVVLSRDEAAVGNVVRGNIFSNMFDGASLYAEQARGATRSMDVYDNRFIACADDAIEADGFGTNVRIYGNRMDDVRSCVSVAPSAPGPTYIMRNQLGPSPSLGQDGRIPVKFNCGRPTLTQHVYLYHNTMFSDVPGQPAFVFHASRSTWTNVMSRNNLYVGAAYGFYDKAAAGSIDFDYDNCFGGGGPMFGWWRGEPCRTFRAFQLASHQERHGWSISPGWMNPKGGDFRLRAGSPMVDRATPIPGVNDAFAGAAPDVGAQEYTPASALRPPPHPAPR
jgi:hypothetical protein